MAKREFASFRAFWFFYLGEHAHPTNRALHFIGSSLALLAIGAAIALRAPWFILAALLCGYGFAWIGHFFVEKNRPASFSYFFRSFACDWVMYFYILTGQIGKQLQLLERQTDTRNTTSGT